jgi:ribosomal protein S4E
MNFPAGFMDVVEIEKSDDRFRLLYDTKGRFVLHRLDKAEAGFKVCKVVRQELTKKGIPTITTHDGRTIRYPSPDIKKFDSVKLDLATGKVVDHAKFGVGCLVMVTNGRNQGRVGTLVDRERHPGSFDIVHIRDARDTTFATRLGNVFVIGRTSEEPLVTLPRNSGIKYNIFEQRDARIKAASA